MSDIYPKGFKNLNLSLTPINYNSNKNWRNSNKIWHGLMERTDGNIWRLVGSNRDEFSMNLLKKSLFLSKGRVVSMSGEVNVWICGVGLVTMRGLVDESAAEILVFFVSSSCIWFVFRNCHVLIVYWNRFTRIIKLHQKHSESNLPCF